MQLNCCVCLVPVTIAYTVQYPFDLAGGLWQRVGGSLTPQTWVSFMLQTAAHQFISTWSVTAGWQLMAVYILIAFCWSTRTREPSQLLLLPFGPKYKLGIYRLKSVLNSRAYNIISAFDTGFGGRCEPIILRTLPLSVQGTVLNAFHHHHHHYHHRHHHHLRLYSPGWALDSSSKNRQQPLPWATASQFLQRSLLASSSPP